MSVIQREFGSLRRAQRRLWGGFLLACAFGVGPAEAMDEACTQPDLRGADLSGLDCADLYRPGADLSPAVGPPEVATNIQGTDFDQAILTGSDMTEVQGGCTSESCTRFEGALLESTTWTDAFLGDVSFFDANLDSALFTGADLGGAEFAQSNLANADLSTAALQGTHATDLSGCPGSLPAEWFCLAFNLVGPGADLSGAELSGEDLADLNLASVVFTSANLTGADLRDADLTDANWTGAILDGADLSGAVLVNRFPSIALSADQMRAASSVSGVWLNGADLTGFELNGADFSQADFSESELTGVDLSPDVTDPDEPQSSILTGVDFSFAQSDCSWGGSERDPNCSNFSEVIFESADFTGARLDGAVFRGSGRGDAGAACTEATCLFGSASLRGSDLGDADFRGAHFFNASLDQADLGGADFSGANLALARLDGASAVCDPVCAVTFDLANLELASLQDVDFSSGSFVDAILKSADLTRATLSDALMAGSIMSYSLVSGTRFSGARLTTAQLDYASGACAPPPAGSGDEVDWCPDFSQSDLTDANLSYASIEGAIMTQANLSGADLSDAVLNGLSTPCSEPEEEGALYSCMTISSTTMAGLVSRDADWAGVDLSSVSAVGADFTGTFFYRVRSIQPEEGATFDQAYVANLSGATLAGGHFGTADLTEVNLSGADLAGADLNGAKLLDARLTGTNLSSAMLDQADLSGARLDGGTVLLDADFSSATLREADLQSVDFLNAEFAKGAVIEDGLCILPQGGTAVDLVGALLGEADFSAAPQFLQGCIAVDATTTYTAGTKFPEGFDLQDEMTRVPEPTLAWLQGAALAGLGLLRLRKARTGRARPTSQLR